MTAAAPGPALNIYGISQRQLWWASLWPLFLVVIVCNVILPGVLEGQAPQPSGGLARNPFIAAVFWASVLSWRYTRQPVESFREAFTMALWPLMIVLGAFSVGLSVVFGTDDPVMDFTLAEAEGALMALAWAPIIVRRGKKLMHRYDRAPEPKRNWRDAL